MLLIRAAHKITIGLVEVFAIFIAVVAAPPGLVRPFWEGDDGQQTDTHSSFYKLDRKSEKSSLVEIEIWIWYLVQIQTQFGWTWGLNGKNVEILLINSKIVLESKHPGVNIPAFGIFAHYFEVEVGRTRRTCPDRRLAWWPNKSTTI